MKKFENLNKEDVSILGFSQGGSICWKLGLDNSSNFRRVIPISSFIHPSYLNNDLESYTNRLIYCSHGSLDDVIPLNIVDDHILRYDASSFDLKAEFSDVAHTRGVLSAARSADPDSANSQFFICFGPTPHLDRQYTVFGKVLEGMEFVDMITKGDGPNGSVSNPDKIISFKSE